MTIEWSATAETNGFSFTVKMLCGSLLLSPVAEVRLRTVWTARAFQPQAKYAILGIIHEMLWRCRC